MCRDSGHCAETRIWLIGEVDSVVSFARVYRYPILMTSRAAGLNPKPTLERTNWLLSALYWNAVSCEKPAPSLKDAPRIRSECFAWSSGWPSVIVTRCGWTVSYTHLTLPTILRV